MKPIGNLVGKVLGVDTQPTTIVQENTGLTDADMAAISEEEAQRKAQQKRSGTQTILTQGLGSGAPTTNRPTLG